MEKKFYGIKFSFFHGEDLLDLFTAIKREEYDETYMIIYATKWLEKHEDEYGDCYKFTLYDENAKETREFFIF